MGISKAGLRKGELRKDMALADGAGMDAGAEDILFSVALPDDAAKRADTLNQAADDAEKQPTN